MQSDEAAEPVEWDLRELKETLAEWEMTAAEIARALHEQGQRDQSANWRPHLAQMDKALSHYRELCRLESERLGSWREDGLQADEVYESIWEQGDRLTKWLLRML